MKNKRSIYILLPAVALVWGIIIYKIFQAVDDKSVVNPLEVSQLQATENEMVKADTYQLALNYRDPFLGRTYAAPKKAPVKSSAAIPDSAATDNPESVRAELFGMARFQGMIENPGQSLKVGLLILHDRQQIVKPGDSFGDIQVVEIAENGMRVRFRGREFYLPKNIGETGYQ